MSSVLHSPLRVGQRAKRCCGAPAAARPVRQTCLRVRAVLEQDPQLSAARLRLENALLHSIAPSMAPEQQRQLPPRVLATTDGEVMYLAYGANMALSVLRRRGVAPLSRAPAVVVDRSVRLCFQHRGGYSTLLPVPPGQQTQHTPYTGCVHGVLYQLTREDMQRLARHEGGYQLVDVEVETYDGWSVRAKTFVSSPLARLAAEVVPTEKYMRLLREGAADNFLDPLYQGWLSGIDTIPSAGLPAAYWNTPSKHIAYGFLALVALLVVGFFSQH